MEMTIIHQHRLLRKVVELVHVFDRYTDVTLRNSLAPGFVELGNG